MIDRESPTWQIVKAHAEKRIEQGRDTLELPDDPRNIAHEQGRIAALREVLKLADPVVMPIGDMSTY